MQHTQLTGHATLVTFLMLALWGTSPVFAQQVLVKAQRGKVGETTTVMVSLDQTARAINALGLTLVYDPGVLRYTGTFTKGPLVRGFDFFDVHERQPGQIRVGGFTTKEAIAQGASGDMVSLAFTVRSAGTTTVRIVHLVDDLAGLTTIPGTFIGETAALQGTPPVITLVTQIEP